MVGHAVARGLHQVGDDLHARHAAQVVRYRCWVSVAQAGRPGAHQHVLVAQVLRTQFAAQDGQVGDGTHVASGARVRDQDVAAGLRPL
ncbi:hypothetical protein D3C72_1113070 [compost metagenome]